LLINYKNIILTCVHDNLAWFIDTILYPALAIVV